MTRVYISNGVVAMSKISTPATPAADEIGIYCNTSETPSFINDAGAAFALAYQTTGTWTPIVQFGGAAVGVTYTTQVGRYLLIDDFCLAWGYAVLSSKGSSTGSATFGTLPFTALNVSSAFVPVTLWASNLASVSGHLQGFVTPNTAGVTLSYLGTGTTTTLDNTNFANNTSWMLQVLYQTT